MRRVVGGERLTARGQQPVQPPHPVRQRAGRHLRARAGPRRLAVQQRHALVGQWDPQGGHGVPVDGRAAGEAHPQQLAHAGPRAVAADQVTSAPPRGVGALGADADTAVVLLDGVDASPPGRCVPAPVPRGPPAARVRGVPARCAGGRAPVRRRPGRRTPRGRSPAGGAASATPPRWRRSRRAFDGPAGRAARRSRDSGRPCVPRRAGARGRARPARCSARRAVRGRARGRADRTRPRDDHRVHCVVPGRCAVTLRMQPTARACVK